MTLPAKIYDVDVSFPSSPLNKTPVISEKNAHVLIGPFEERDLTELAHGAVRDRPLLCRTTSNDIKWVNSHCQLQVIQEVDEEEIADGEEAEVGAWKYYWLLFNERLTESIGSLKENPGSVPVVQSAF